jgi:hypothetical protein
MDIQNFDQNEITFSDPEPISDEEYLCPSKLQNGDDVIYMFDNTFSVVDKSEKHITINMDNKEILKGIKNLQELCVDKIFSNSKEWFEDEIKFEDVKDNFKPFVVPNIEENCIVFEIEKNGVDDDALSKDAKIRDIKIIFSGVVFDGSKFKMIFKLSSFENVLNEPLIEDEQTTETDDMQEVEIKSDNIEEQHDVKMNFEKDNLFMVYDIINEKLKNNLLFNLQEAFETKNINISDFDLEEIMFEDEYSDDDSE